MNSIELFAGAGGLALGLEQAGFEHLGLVEFNREAADTLVANRPQWKVLCEDIALVAERDLETLFNAFIQQVDIPIDQARELFDEMVETPFTTLPTVGKKETKFRACGTSTVLTLFIKYVIICTAKHKVNVSRRKFQWYT